MSGISDLYDYSVHELDALLAREGLAIRVAPLSLSSSPVGGFTPPPPWPACRGWRPFRGDRMSANPQSIASDSPRPFVPWGELSAPINAGDTRLMYLAQSVLTGPDLGVCPPLTLDQALDVLRWAGRLPTEDAKASA
jgi:hypothetical protein